MWSCPWNGYSFYSNQAFTYKSFLKIHMWVAKTTSISSDYFKKCGYNVGDTCGFQGSDQLVLRSHLVKNAWTRELKSSELTCFRLQWQPNISVQNVWKLISWNHCPYKSRTWYPWTGFLEHLPIHFRNGVSLSCDMGPDPGHSMKTTDIRKTLLGRTPNLGEHCTKIILAKKISQISRNEVSLCTIIRFGCQEI